MVRDSIPTFTSRCATWDFTRQDDRLRSLFDGLARNSTSEEEKKNYMTQERVARQKLKEQYDANYKALMNDINLVRLEMLQRLPPNSTTAADQDVNLAGANATNWWMTRRNQADSKLPESSGIAILPISPRSRNCIF
jgi:hypothetical protein